MKQGNARYMAGEMKERDFSVGRAARASAQYPIVAVLACADSRVPPEIIFDQGIGDIFVVRLLGNVCNNEALGCIEFASEYLHVPLIVVMGHTDCQAVKAVVNRERMYGNIPTVLTNVNWAVAKTAKAGANLHGKKLLDAAIEGNVWQSIEDLFKGSRHVCLKVRSGELKVVGAVYDLENGRVNWLGEHPNQKGLI